MKKVVLIILVLAGAVKSVAQNNVYGKKVVGLDSLVADTIRARTQSAPYIEGFGTGVAGNNTEIQFNDNGAFGASSDLTWDGTDLGVTGSLTVDNLTLDGNIMSSSTGTIDLVPTGTEDVRITNGGDLILLNSSSRIVTPRIYTSSGGSSSAVSYYINNDENTGIYSGQADHLDIAAGGIDIINIDNTGIDVTGNATFSGDIIASSGDIYLGASSPHLTLSGGSNGSSGGQIQLNGEGASAANDIIFLSSGTEVGRWDELGNHWEFSNKSFIDIGQVTTSDNLTVGGKIGVNGASTTFPLNILSTTQQVALDIDGQNTTATILSIDNDNANSQSFIRFQNQGSSSTSIGFNDNLNVVGISHTANLDSPDFYIDNSGNATFSGDVSITGSLSKGSGTFKITHPLDTNKWLYHSFVEAPRADNIYRGQVELYRGIARVGIDTASNMMEGTFDLLNQNVQVFVTNNDTWDRVRGYYSNGIIYIECQNELSRAVVDWLVIGERKDQTVIDWNLTDENGQLIPEWNKQDEN